MEGQYHPMIIQDKGIDRPRHTTGMDAVTRFKPQNLTALEIRADQQPQQSLDGAPGKSYPIGERLARIEVDQSISIGLDSIASHAHNGWLQS